MKATVEVQNKTEATLIKSGLEDPIVRAFVLVTATLNALPSDRARRRVLQYAQDRMEELAEEAADYEVIGGTLPVGVHFTPGKDPND